MEKEEGFWWGKGGRDKGGIKGRVKDGERG